MGTEDPKQGSPQGHRLETETEGEKERDGESPPSAPPERERSSDSLWREYDVRGLKDTIISGSGRDPSITVYPVCLSLLFPFSSLRIGMVCPYSHRTSVQVQIRVSRLLLLTSKRR